MVPADDQAMVLPCASEMVIMVLLNEAFTCATPEAMFFLSRRRTRVASLPIDDPHVVRAVAGRCFKIIRSVQSASSCRQLSSPDPCGCGRWCACADRALANLCGDANRDSSRDPSAA